jgi:hypothetical protein
VASKTQRANGVGQLLMTRFVLATSRTTCQPSRWHLVEVPHHSISDGDRLSAQRRYSPMPKHRVTSTLRQHSWGRNKSCSQTHGNVIRSKYVGQETDQKIRAMAECSLDLGVCAVIQGRTPDGKAYSSSKDRCERGPVSEKGCRSRLAQEHQTGTRTT